MMRSVQFRSSATSMVAAVVSALALVIGVLPATSAWATDVVLGTESASAGPAVTHVPVRTAQFGHDIAITADSVCHAGASCTATLHWRVTPPDGVGVLPDGSPVGGSFTVQGVSVSASTLQNSPAWSTQAMTAAPSPTVPAAAASAVPDPSAQTWTGTIPAYDVTERGVDYYLEFTENTSRTVIPGAPSVSANGSLIAPAAGTFWHVTTESVPIIHHTPVLYTPADTAVPISAEVNCPISSCTATLWYRSTPTGVQVQPVVGQLTWPHVDMTKTPLPADPVKGNQRFTVTATIPASVVITTGVDYTIQLTMGSRQAWAPGTSPQGYYAPTDGTRVAYYTIHVFEPPHMTHVTPGATPYRTPTTITATTNCPVTRTCSGRLYYRTTVSDVLNTDRNTFASIPLTVVRTTIPLPNPTGTSIVTATGIIPASVADTRGIDYFFFITDGTTTAWYPGTSPVSTGYVAVDGTYVAFQHIRVLDPPHFVHQPVLAAPTRKDLTVSTQLTCATEACRVELTYTVKPKNGSSSYRTVAMTRTAVVTTTTASRLETWSYTVPGSQITTAGFAYSMYAYDGYVHAASPGTDYQGAYVPLDGTHVNGANVGLEGEDAVYYDLTPAAHLMWPVRILEPPNIVLNPAVAPGYLKPVTVTGLATCTQRPCTTVLSYGPPGTPGKKVNLTQTPVSTGTDAGDLLAVSYTIPAADVTLEGLNYSARIEDGSTSMDTLVLPVVIPNARRSGFAVTADTALIPPAVCGSNCAPQGSTTSLPLTTDGTTASRILLRIDTSDIPRDHKVGTARLTLQTTGDPGTAEVRAVLTPWDEATATWANAPAVAPDRQPTTDDPSTGSITAAIVPGATDINIAPLVQKWVNNPATNYGLQLSVTGPVARSATLNSRESTLAPKLTVTHASTDLQGPTVTMVRPTSSDTLFQVETVSATLSDDVAVASAELRVDEQRVATDTSAPWDFTLDTRNYSNGPHRVDVLGTDTSGNISRASVTVRFRNDLPSSDRVAEDRRRGTLTDYRYVALGAVVETAPNSALPDRYRSTTAYSSVDAVKSWVEHLAPYMAALDQLQSNEKSILLEYLYSGKVGGGGGRIPGFAAGASSIVPPAAIRAAISSPQTQVPIDPNWHPHSTCNPDEYNYVSSTYCTVDSYEGHFHLRWDINAPGSGTDSMTWNGASYVNGSDGVPDFVDQALQGFDQGWSTYQALGFTTPDRTVQVQLGDFDRSNSLPPLQAAVPLYIVGGVSFTVTYDRAPVIHLDSAKPGWDYGIAEEARHELFHQFQYAAGVTWTDLASYGEQYTEIVRPDTAWWMEATANWAAHQAAPYDPSGQHHVDNRETTVEEASLTRTYAQMPNFLATPEKPLFSDWNGRGYGGAILADYLSDQYGTDVIRGSIDRLSSDGGSNAVKHALEAKGSNWSYALDGFWDAVYTFTQAPPGAIVKGRFSGSPSRTWDIQRWHKQLDIPGERTRARTSPNVASRIATEQFGELQPTGSKPVTRSFTLGAGGSYFLEAQVPRGTSGELVVNTEESVLAPAQPVTIRSTITSYGDHPTICSTGSLEHPSPTGTIQVGSGCSLVTLRIDRSDPTDVRDNRNFVATLTFRVYGVELSSGQTRLGVFESGRLGITDVDSPDQSYEATRHVAIRNASNFEAGMRGGCPCEGWGVVSDQAGTRGKASITSTENVTAGAMTYNTERTEATTIATVGGASDPHALTVKHHFYPGADPNIYYVEVTITRSFDDTIAGPATIHYRRNLDMDVTDDSEASWVSLRKTDPHVTRLTDHGSADSYPDVDDLQSRCVGSICEPAFHEAPVTDDYGDYGGSMTMDFQLAQYTPSVTFRLVYVTADTPQTATSKLASVGVTTYAIGSAQPASSAVGRRDAFGFGYASYSF